MNDIETFDLAVRLATKFYAMRSEIVHGLGLREMVDITVALLGLFTMFICLCRMSQLTKRHLLLPRLSYVGLFTASFCLSFSPWLFGAQFVRVGSVIFVSAVIAHLIVIGLSWRRGPPPEMETAPTPLE